MALLAGGPREDLPQYPTTGWLAPLTWVLEKVCLHQVVEDVVFTDPLDWTAAGGAQGGALHPA